MAVHVFSVKAVKVSTKDLILKDVDNSKSIYTDKEREQCIPLRIGEIRALQWSDVDFGTKQIYVHREVVRDKKTTDTYRQLVLLGLYLALMRGAHRFQMHLFTEG